MQEVKTTKEQVILQCPRYNKARLICVSPFCQLCAFICYQQDCQQCCKNHKNCKSIKVQYILQSIISKKQQIKPQILSAIRALQKAYDDSIQRLSKDKQFISGQVSMLGYNSSEVQFMSLINDGLSSQVTGKLSSKILQELSIKNQWLATQEFIQKYWSRKKCVFNDIFDRLKQIINMGLPTIDSAITDQIDKIVQFFGQDYPIASFQLLYRASQKSFSANTFHQLCDGVSNTLILIKTQFAKVIGGFTPLAWNQTGNYIAENAYQKGAKSFIFSITNNEKYECVQGQYAICGSNGAGPAFGGGHDIYISDNSNTMEYGSYFNFPNSYNNGKYSNNQQSYSSFCGVNNGDYYARVFQWQVFKVQFK